MKFLIGTILLLASCGSDPSQFETDFGSKELTFTHCSDSNGAIDIVYTVEYISDNGGDPYNYVIKVTANGAADTSDYQRLPSGNKQGNFVYLTIDHDIQITSGKDNDDSLVVNQVFCSE
jgi:hypothetical protein